MFPTFISILDIQSWWEVPSIAHFCSLFRSSFNLLDFDIEDLEEALLADGTEENSWLQELIVRLLTGCLPNNEISTFNYQMFLRRLFREKCKEHDRYNPFNTDIDFQLLPLRTKVDILYALCDFRLDAEDVLEQLKNLEADSLRVEPLGYDNNDSAYWYFYGTRLYREDFKSKNKKGKKSIWQVICFTEEDWFQLAKKFKKSQSKNEKKLLKTLTENFLPELPRLFHEKERLARKRLLENQPRRASIRIGVKKKQESETEEGKKIEATKTDTEVNQRQEIEVEKELEKSQINKTDKVENSRYEMARDKTRGKKGSTRSRKNSDGSCSGGDNSSSVSRSTVNTSYRNSDRNRNKQASTGTVKAKTKSTNSSTTLTTTVGRQTNNSLASATGQIVIQADAAPRTKKLKTSQVFRQTEEDLQVGIHKILDYVRNQEDAWPFIDPVEEEYAPNYYSIVRKPMDLQRMEDRLDSGYYKTFSRFKTDFQLIVDNCRLYNGADNEYTDMVGNLAQAFEKATKKYLDQVSSSDEEIRIEYLPAKAEEAIGNDKKEPVIPLKKKRERDDEQSIEPAKKKRDHEDDMSKIKTKKNIKELSPEMSSEKNVKSSIKHKKKDKKDKKLTNKMKNSSERGSESRSPVSIRKSFSQSPSTHRWSSSPPPSWPPSPDSTDTQFYGSKNAKNCKKDKENKKDKWDELISKNNKKCHKSSEKQHSPQRPKDKHNKLRETIEKLKAKSEISKKFKENYLEEIVFKNSTVKDNKSDSSTNLNHKKLPESKRKEKRDKSRKKSDFDDSSPISNDKSKKNSVKNTTIEALTLVTEQTLKDINKWLDDTPKLNEDFSSASNSPSYCPVISEDYDNIGSKLDNDLQKKIERNPEKKKDTPYKDVKKKVFCRDISKIIKKREVQRTIDRLQPGKSKGNLITNVQSTQKADQLFPLSSISKAKGTKNSLIVKTDENAPKLSLGSVLDSFGKHKFVDNEEPVKIDQLEQEVKVALDEDKTKDNETPGPKDTKETETKNITKNDPKTSPTQQHQLQVSPGKATPNLSAWFKAFGTPKVPSTPTQTKKTEESPNKTKEEDKKVVPPDPSPNLDVQSLQGTPTSRQRKASTGSSVSERSSYSQDMDSPRVGIDERLGAYPAPYPSPLHKSPPLMPSPRPDVSPKATTSYPTLNGQMRVGFYQDTVSTKSSPENPQSPYYSEHIYSPASMQTAPCNYSPYYPTNYSGSNPTPPHKSEGNVASYYEQNKALGYHETVGSPNYQPSKRSPVYSQQAVANSPNYQPSSNSPGYQSAQNSPNYAAVNSPNYAAAHNMGDSPSYTSLNSPHSPVNSNGFSRANSPNYQSNNSPLQASNSPNYQASGSPLQSCNSPGYLGSNSTPNHHYQSPQYQSLNSPNYQQTQNSSTATFQQNVKQTFRAPADAFNTEPTANSAGFNANIIQPNSPYPSPAPVTQEFDEFQQNKPTHHVFPVKKRAFSDVNNQGDSVFPTQQQNVFMNRNFDAPPTQQVKTSNDLTIQLQQTQKNSSQNQLSNDSTMIQVKCVGALKETGLECEGKASNESYVTHSHPDIYNSNYPLNIPCARPIDLNARSEVPKVTKSDDSTQFGDHLNNYNVPNNLRLGSEGLGNRLNNATTTGNYKPQEIASSYKNPTSLSAMEQSLNFQRNLATLSHIVDRYQTGERILQGLQSTTSYYSDKSLVSQIYTKPNTTTSLQQMFNQSISHYTGQNVQNSFNRTVEADVQQQQPHLEKKSKRKKSTKNVPAPVPQDTPSVGPSFHSSYSGLKNMDHSAIALKSSGVVPGSAFNFGSAAASGLGLTSGLYSDKDAYSNFLEEYRASPNYYMAAAAAAHHRNPASENSDKQARVVQQQTTSAPSPASYPFIGAPQPRPPSYPFITPHQASSLMDPSSPLYQQYLQAGVLHQGLLGTHGPYPPGYLGMRQPFDSMARPPWL